MTEQGGVGGARVARSPGHGSVTDSEGTGRSQQLELNFILIALRAE